MNYQSVNQAMNTSVRLAAYRDRAAAEGVNRNRVSSQEPSSSSNNRLIPYASASEVARQLDNTVEESNTYSFGQRRKRKKTKW